MSCSPEDALQRLAWNQAVCADVLAAFEAGPRGRVDWERIAAAGKNMCRLRVRLRCGRVQRRACVAVVGRLNTGPASRPHLQARFILALAKYRPDLLAALRQKMAPAPPPEQGRVRLHDSLLFVVSSG